LLVGGLALLRRERLFLGAVVLTVTGLLRFFPGIFVGGLGLFALFAVWRSRRLESQSRRVLGGIAVSMLIGLGAGAAAYGPGVYGEFLANMQGHSALPPGNTIGLGALVSAGLNQSALRSLQNPTVGSGEVLRAAIWLVGLFASLALVTRQAWRGCALWEAIPWSAPLLFCAIPLSGYDYARIVVLAPVAASSKFRTVSLLAFVALSGLLINVVGHTPTVYAILSALFALSCALVLWRWRGWLSPDGDFTRRPSGTDPE
jgi:hypothetical protein